jgi:hypothetical protein
MTIKMPRSLARDIRVETGDTVTPQTATILHNSQALHAMKHDVVGLLQRLEHERLHLDWTLAERGEDDPIREVTGRSALDEAIREVQGMMTHLERLLSDAQAPPLEPEPLPVMHCNGSSHGVATRTRVNGTS